MPEDVDKSPSAAEGQSAQGRKQSEREQRLAAALRENLRRRKDQARGRRAAGASAGEGES